MNLLQRIITISKTESREKCELFYDLLIETPYLNKIIVHCYFAKYYDLTLKYCNHYVKVLKLLKMMNY